MKRSPNTSQYIGVSWNRKHQKFEAKIRYGYGRRVHLGFHDTSASAARAYNIAALQLLGQFAVINHLDGDEWLQKHRALQTIGDKESEC